jgi:GGDEF domain-containing protein
MLTNIKSIERWIEGAARGSTFCLLDIDNMHQYNEFNGFEGGNMLLEHIEQFILEMDFVDGIYRFGSDEFLFVMGQHSSKRDDVLSRVLLDLESNFGVTVSIGAARQEKSMIAKDLVLMLKRFVMYAKLNGKNLICIQ